MLSCTHIACSSSGVVDHKIICDISIPAAYSVPQQNNHSSSAVCHQWLLIRHHWLPKLVILSRLSSKAFHSRLSQGWNTVAIQHRLVEMVGLWQVLGLCRCLCGLAILHSNAFCLFSASGSRSSVALDLYCLGSHLPVASGLSLHESATGNLLGFRLARW